MKNKTILNEENQKKGTIKNNSASASGSQKVVYLLVCYYPTKAYRNNCPAIRVGIPCFLMKI